MAEVFLEAMLDALKIFPIIFIVYAIIEYIELGEAKKPKMKKVLSNRFSPFFGAVLGIIPQCGFSVVATNFYQKRYIRLGTLIAVFIATSDEALPILLSRAITDYTVWGKLFNIIFCKFIYAVIIGFLINLIFSKKEQNFASEACEIEEEKRHDGCCGHEIAGTKKNFLQFLSHPFFHSLKIILFIFAVNFILGVVIDLVIGTERLSAFLTGAKGFEPMVCALVGIIPNCAVSVALTELYVDNLISFAGVIAGLTANSGLGLLMLFKDRKNIKRALFITLLTFALAIVIGYTFYFIGR